MLYTLLHAAAFAGPALAWGLDSAVYQNWLLLAFGGTVLVILVPRARNEAAVLAGRADGWIRERGSRRAALVLGFLSLTTVLTSGTPLLGDGQLHIRELAGDMWVSHPHTNRAPLTFYFVHGIYQQLSSYLTAGEVYAWMSRASGVVFVILSLAAAGRFGLRTTDRWVVFLVLMTQGYLQLFFGYIETYSVLFPLTLGYLVLCHSAQRGHTPTWVPAGYLGVTVTAHFVTLALAPAVLVAALTRPAAGREQRVIALSGLGALPIATVLVLTALGLPADALLKAETGSHLLPLSGELLKNQPHHLVTWDHLVAVANQYALVAPAFLVCAGLGTTALRSADRVDLMLLAAAVPLAIFTVTFNPEIGAFRDWDAFSLPALPLSLLAARWLCRVYSCAARRHRAAAVVVLVSATHTLGWVTVNADESAAATRFARLVRNAGNSTVARSYGSGSLAAYYRDRGQLDTALAWFQEAGTYDPGNSRYDVGRAFVLNQQGDAAGAERALQTALAKTPDRIDALINLGKLYLDQGRVPEARRVLVRAVRLNAGNVQALRALGLAAYRVEDYDRAELLFGRASELDPDDPDHRVDRASALFARSKYAEAERVLREVLDGHGNHVRARMLLGAISHEREDYAAAAAAFRSVLDVDSTYVDAVLNLGLSLYAAGRGDEAGVYLRRALALGTDRETEREVRGILRGLSSGTAGDG